MTGKPLANFALIFMFAGFFRQCFSVSGFVFLFPISWFSFLISVSGFVFLFPVSVFLFSFFWSFWVVFLFLVAGIYFSNFWFFFPSSSFWNFISFSSFLFSFSLFVIFFLRFLVFYFLFLFPVSKFSPWCIFMNFCLLWQGLERLWFKSCKLGFQCMLSWMFLGLCIPTIGSSHILIHQSYILIWRRASGPRNKNGFELLIANDLDCWQGLFKLTMKSNIVAFMVLPFVSPIL